ncbi:Chemotaxis protein CheY [Gemmata sp. SH-PL17]|uniref:response regulator n=1 Tax=Gemmata sp. SH-PL17 TaxID=1630693 RepID=UPI00078C18CC|nr:response regulator [Gemmata sp. SH-PL17]AMV24048.1 Chemotaxis protein CheY [Gemmata sp. SH-PL17]
MSPPDSVPPTVLVADDEGTVLQMLEVVLTRAGFGVRTACGGVEAVAEYRRGGVDLVLLDVQMVPPWDGPRTLVALRDLDPGARVVFMSGSTGPYRVEELLALGAVRVLSKPFPSLKNLIAELRSALPSDR